MRGEMAVEELGPGPLAAEAVEVCWEATPLALAAEARAYVERRWAAYQDDARRQGKDLFNAAVARLVGFSHADRCLRVTLGPSDYKTFLVTTLRDRAWFEQHAPAAIAPAPGNSALLTHGDQALLGIRSQRVSAYPARAHLFGGALDLSDGPPTSLAMVLAHLRRELREELGLGAEDFVGTPRLLGFFRDAFLGQPEFTWQWELRAPVGAYAARIRPQEHDGVLELDATRPDPELLTPLAHAAWTRWRSLRASGDPLQE